MDHKTLSFKRCHALFLFFFMSQLLWAQQTKVSGNLISENDGQPIIGASILESGTGNGVISDINGNFFITVKRNAKLQISCVGYTTKVVTASPQMRILLGEDLQKLNEVVVVGYSTQKKADLTGAVSVVSTESLKTMTNADPMRALQGRIAGMTITQDGNPTGTGTVRIRGIGSINSSQDPLYVIDGVPTTQSLISFNANDIESIQVLKDAASASIYGSRAANGVIIITTKKGSTSADNSGTTNIDFSANLTASYYASQSKMKLLNSQQYVQAMAQAALNDGLNPATYASNYGVKITANPDGTYSGSGLYDGYINSKKTMLYSNTDWLDAISRTGTFQDYNIAFRRGTSKGSAMFSLGYKDNEGILKYTNFKSISGRVNTSYNLSKYVVVGENVTVAKTNQIDPPDVMNYALKMPSIVPVYEINGTTFGGPVGGMSDRQNPLRMLYQNRENNKDVWRILGNAYIDIKPLKGLLIRSNFGVDFEEYFKRNITHTYYSDVVNNATASVTCAHANDSKWNWSNTAQYDFTYKAHKVSVLGGIELYKQNRVDFSNYSEGYEIETYDYMWPDASTGTQFAYGNGSGYALVSFFGKLNYNFSDKYLASFTLRRDGSSRFGSNNRYAMFPAATLGWRISNESFMSKTNPWLSDLKLRASWGKTGNQAISNTARYGLYTSDYGQDRGTGTAYDIYLQNSGTFPSGYRQIQATNNNLKWETAIQYDLGLDFGLFNGTIYGTYDAYIKDIKDMLISPSYLGSKGEGGASWANGPSMRNWGMELSLGYRKTLLDGLGVDVLGSVDFFRNKVTYLPATTTGSYAHTTKQNLVQSKQPYGSSVGYVVEGLFQTMDEVYASGQSNARLGGLKYADLDGDGVIDADDQTWIYNPVPDFSYGLNIALNYKGFDLSMFWQGVYGVDVWNNQKYQTDFWSIDDPGSNKGTRLLNAWTATNPNSTIPALTTNNIANENRSSTYYVENGSYLKLRTLQIGYNLPKSVVKKASMQNARIYLSGSNLLTIKSKSLTCSDPENPSWNYPLSSSISCGVQIGF